MKFSLKREIVYWVLCLIPFIFLAAVYKSMPVSVPTHFDIDGKIDDWSSKSSLWVVPASTTVFIYLLLIIAPKIDPKQRLIKYPGKSERFKFIMLLFITTISCFCIYISYKQSIAHLDKFLFSIIGLFFAALGNFFPALKPNYFMGIRSPWALENEIVWKKTHQFAGKLWVIGGLFLAFLPFLLTNTMLMFKIFISVTLFIALVPIAFSFIVWRKLKNGKIIE